MRPPRVVVIVFVAAAFIILSGGARGGGVDGGDNAGDHNQHLEDDDDVQPHIPPDEQLQLCDPTFATDDYVPNSLLHIDAVHRTGAPHRGVWLFVVDSQERVLLVHRSPRMVTCPNTWSLVGTALHVELKQNSPDATLRLNILFKQTS